MRLPAAAIRDCAFADYLPAASIGQLFVLSELSMWFHTITYAFIRFVNEACKISWMNV